MSPPRPDRPRRRRWRRVLWRWRHLLLAAAVVVTASAVVSELRPSQPRTTAVVVLARDVAAGTALAGPDLRTAHLPPGLVGPHVVGDADEVLGERLAVGLPAGFPLTDRMLVGPGLAAGIGPGEVVVPVRLADAGVSATLRAGDLVDLLAATADVTGGPGGAHVVAAGALVLARQDDGDGGGLLMSEQTTSLVFVAVPRDLAPDVVGAGAWAPLRVVLPG